MVILDIKLPPKHRHRVRNRNRAEWRGSDDAVTWTQWYPLYSKDMLVLHYNYYQARIEVCGEWFTSPITFRDNLFKF